MKLRKLRKIAAIAIAGAAMTGIFGISIPVHADNLSGDRTVIIPSTNSTQAENVLGENTEVFEDVIVGIDRVMDGDTTWQNDWTFRKGIFSIELERYRGTEADVKVPAIAIINGTEYGVLIKEGAFSTNKTIENVSFEQGVALSSSMRGGLFKNCINLETVDLSGLDTYGTVDMHDMFNYCRSLNSINFGEIDTGSVVNMKSMFCDCVSLENLDLSGFDTHAVCDMSYMFKGCSSLKSVVLSSFDTGNVTNMLEMFSGCSSLTEIDVSKFDTGNVEMASYMFNFCPSLKKLDLSGFDFAKVKTANGFFSQMKSLTTLQTPTSVGIEIQLPTDYKDSSSGQRYQVLPMGDESAESHYLVRCGTEAVFAPARTEEQIREYISAHPFDLKKADTWTVEPSPDNEIAGELSEETRENALNTLNVIRYIAGLSEVGYSTEYEETCQAGTTLLAGITQSTGINLLTHFPPQLEGVSDKFYLKGTEGTTSSNLAYGNSIASGLVYGWMDDTGIDGLGHRLHCLVPSMNLTGFGHSGIYVGMYVLGTDHTSWGFPNGVVTWPAQTMPIDLFSGPWSVSISREVSTLENSDISVTMENMTDGAVYTLSETDADKDQEYLYVKDAYSSGFEPAIIFDPGVDFAAGDTVKVSVKGIKDRTGEDVTVDYTVTFLQEAVREDVSRFMDVKQEDWYYNAVMYVYNNNIMAGMGDEFGSNNPLTREQFAQVLYNHKGKPAVTIGNKFPDVDVSMWYKNSVLWANENGIASGNGDGSFGVGQNITREALALMLYKYAKLSGFDMTATEGAIEGFADTANVSSWAQEALNWAVTKGIMSGKGSGDDRSTYRLDPQGEATRAECASMMKKLLTMGQ